LVKKSSRAQARRIKDRWKAKEWYTIKSPEMFDNRQIAETIADDGSKVIGRVTEVTLHDLTGDFSKMHIKLRFKVDDVKGFDAHTRFIGHNLTSDYIRRLTRRKRSKMDGVFDVQTKDGAIVRVKPMAITESRIQVSQQQALRAIMAQVIARTAKRKYLSDFIGDMIHGNLPKNIMKNCKKIYPLKRVEVRKSEILRFPTTKKKPSEEVKSEAKEEDETKIPTPEGEEELKVPISEEPDQPKKDESIEEDTKEDYKDEIDEKKVEDEEKPGNDT
jgi:small subunit ribosomal protein S3Ae